MADTSAIIAKIRSCHDPDLLREWIKNARRQEAADVEDAAFRQLISIVPHEAPGTIDHEFWQMVQAFEHVLSEERGKTTRLSRTRQKVQRDGVVKTLVDWAQQTKPTQGFSMLIERDMPEFTGEAIILRHASQFSEAVTTAAKVRLVDAGVDLDRLPRALIS